MGGTQAQANVLAGKTMGPATSRRLSLPQSSSTRVSANGNVVPVNVCQLCRTSRLDCVCFPRTRPAAGIAQAYMVSLPVQISVGVKSLALSQDDQTLLLALPSTRSLMKMLVYQRAHVVARNTSLQLCLHTGVGCQKLLRQPRRRSGKAAYERRTIAEPNINYPCSRQA